MEKEQIIQDSEILAKACQDAQNWIGVNEERVRSCGKSQSSVLVELRHQARLFKMLKRAASRKMCAGVFGPSQAGKSYLLSSLARDSEGNVYCDFNGEQHDFLREINPEGGKESTGLVTRFTMTAPTNYPNGYPVHVRLLSETELVKIFANTYFCDAIHREKVDKDAIRNALHPLESRATSSSVSHIDIDVMEDLHEYVSNSFGDKARPAALDEVYWNKAIELAPKLSRDDRVTLYSIIWDGIEEFSDMLRNLLVDLEKIDFAEEAFCSMKALIPREASIIDVETLGKNDFSNCNSCANIQPTVEVRSPSGKTASILRKNLTAIVAELTLVMVKRPANYFEHTDLLDFPGYKARLEATDLVDYLKSGKSDSAVEQFFRRGKVAYLFQRYNSEHELTSLLLCNSTTDNIPGLPKAVEDWIISTHGKNPEDRVNVKNALFYILTKSDTNFDWGPGKKYETVWDSTIQGKFLAHFSNTFSQTTHWVEKWIPTQPFNNMFMLRNVNIAWKAMMKITNGTEVDIKDTEHAQKMKNAFVNSELVKKHFRSPETAYDELMKLNDGGIEHIKRCLEPLCDPNLKLNQIHNALLRAREKLYSILSPFYHSGNKAEEIKKKQMLFLKIKNLSSNPKFRSRFPELLNSFILPIDLVVYLRDDAERKYDEYKEKLNSIAVNESTFSNDSPMMNSDENMDLNFDLSFDDADSFFGNSTSDTNEKISDENGKETGERDFISFYVERIIEAWNSHCRSKADDASLTGYYMFPQQCYMSMLDEFDSAITRMNLRNKIEFKLREISRFTGEEYQKNRRQASYAISVLNSFLSWLGKNPAETDESDRNVDFNGKIVTVFKNPVPIDGYPELPYKYDPTANAKQWFMDWLVTFYGLLIDNATSDDTGKIDIRQNSILGEILKIIKPE
jgi:hypothetical protein